MTEGKVGRVIEAARQWRKARGMAIEQAATWTKLANAEAELAAAIRDLDTEQQRTP